MDELLRAGVVSIPANNFFKALIKSFKTGGFKLVGYRLPGYVIYHQNIAYVAFGNNVHMGLAKSKQAGEYELLCFDTIDKLDDLTTKIFGDCLIKKVEGKVKVDFMYATKEVISVSY